MFVSLFRGGSSSPCSSFRYQSGLPLMWFSGTRNATSHTGEVDARPLPGMCTTAHTESGVADHERDDPKNVHAV